MATLNEVGSWFVHAVMKQLTSARVHSPAHLPSLSTSLILTCFFLKLLLEALGPIDTLGAEKLLGGAAPDVAPPADGPAVGGRPSPLLPTKMPRNGIWKLPILDEIPPPPGPPLEEALVVDEDTGDADPR